VGADVAGMAFSQPALGQCFDPQRGHAGIFLRQPAENFACPVLRTVIHDNDPHLNAGLRQQPTNGGFDPGFLITRCEDDRA
jgi:hypothetical protein